MPVINAKICKYILDNGGTGKATAESATTLMLAVGANILEGTVADTPAGEKWVSDVQRAYIEYINVNKKFVERFTDLCNRQPVAD